MTRRGFLSRIIKGSVAVAVLAHVPTDTIVACLPRRYRDDYALQFLTKAYNDYMKGKDWQSAPREILAGPKLFERVESEIPILSRRVPVSPDYDGHSILRFKATNLVRTFGLRSDWAYQFVGQNANDCPGGIFEDRRS